MIPSQPRPQHDRTRSDRSGPDADQAHSDADQTALTKTSAWSNRDQMAAAAALGGSPRTPPSETSAIAFRPIAFRPIAFRRMFGLSVMRFGQPLPCRRSSCLNRRLSRTFT
jgi:hypothetical protein